MSQALKEVLQRRVAARRLDCLMVFHRDGEPLIDWRKAWAAHRSQDALGLRSLQHRQRRRSESRCRSTRGLREETTEGNDR